MEKLCRGKISKFQREYGISQKKKILKENLTVGKFRKFFGDYTEKFEIIYNLLSSHVHLKIFDKLQFKNDKIFIINITLQEKAITKNQYGITELIKNKVNYEEYICFKENIKSTYNKMKNDIEYHIMRDPEAAGIVNFVKYEIE